MKLCVKITAGLLLLVQAFQLASLQDSTDSPRKAIDISWLRHPTKYKAGSQNVSVHGQETKYEPRPDETALESSNDLSSGTASGFMVVNPEEEENVAGQDKDANEKSDNVTVVTTSVPPKLPHRPTKHQKLLHATVSPTYATTDLTNSSQINMTVDEEGFNNSTVTPQSSTTHLSVQNSTSFQDRSNHTHLNTTASAPEVNATQTSTTKQDKDTWLSNATESTKKTTVKNTVTPEINQTMTMSASTTAFLSETTESSPGTTTTTVQETTEKANATEKGSASGSGSERGVETDSQRSNRKGAWGAVLGTAVAVACVGLVAYIILKKKHQMGFSHRKLVEEFPSDPVLRLDNSEPLDLKFGGSAYYNPGLQGDNIQMNSLPGRR